MHSIQYSIIILSALRQECTRRCLESIDCHTSPHEFEIIVVDMGLDAHIQEWLLEEKKRRQRFKLILNPHNVGTSKGRNQAVEIAEGDEIIFLDNDTIVTPNWLEHFKEARQRWGNDAILGAKTVTLDGYAYLCDKYVLDYQNASQRNVGLKVIQRYHQDDSEINEETIVPWYATTAMGIHHKTLREISGFDEQLCFIEEDKDLCFRARQKGKFIVYCPSVCIIHDRLNDGIYDEVVRFGNTARLKNDILFFENRWDCHVQLIYSRECLKTFGFSDQMIHNVLNGDLRHFFTVIS